MKKWLSFALVLMLMAGVGPLLWFRKKGWL